MWYISACFAERKEWILAETNVLTCVAIRLEHASLSESIQTTRTEQQQSVKKCLHAQSALFSCVYQTHLPVNGLHSQCGATRPFVSHAFPYQLIPRLCSGQSEQAFSVTLCARLHTVTCCTEWSERQKGDREKWRFQPPFEGKILCQMTCLPVERKREFFVCFVLFCHCASSHREGNSYPVCVCLFVCVCILPALKTDNLHSHTQA